MPELCPHKLTTYYFTLCLFKAECEVFKNIKLGVRLLQEKRKDADHGKY